MKGGMMIKSCAMGGDDFISPPFWKQFGFRKFTLVRCQHNYFISNSGK